MTRGDSEVIVLTFCKLCSGLRLEGVLVVILPRSFLSVVRYSTAKWKFVYKANSGAVKTSPSSATFEI